ncbi:hypothetical protein QEZ54_17815 [Catellatospora sp. KI3]|uniref:hypothetical protein n=1 Tax=Catellatospora sp. KI3 TaxID=3041620 RepID=UPI0024830488|nr:hypothetical protein [Catellatospora sp. KI3]MDI1462836.1 hypothetical protein [Catellatospora sp. KI3]
MVIFQGLQAIFGIALQAPGLALLLFYGIVARTRKSAMVIFSKLQCDLLETQFQEGVDNYGNGIPAHVSGSCAGRYGVLA